MEPLTEIEQRAFLAIYRYDDEPDSIAQPVLESLVRRGLLQQLSDGTYDFTKAGNELFDELMPDEPYEGV